MVEFLDATDDYVPWFNHIFPARITARRTFPAVAIPAGQSGAGLPVWLYEWKEQILDTSATSAGYVDVDGGRVGTLSPLDCPAVEVNNIPVPDGTLVWMRLRGIQQGTQLYEFRNPAAYFGTWVRLTEFYTPDGSYSWKEVYRDSATTWADRLNGLAGIHNARETSTAAGTPGIHAHATTGTVVWLWLAFGDDTTPRWVFFHRESFWAQTTNDPTAGGFAGYTWVEVAYPSGLSGGRSSTSTGLLAQNVNPAWLAPSGTLVRLHLDEGGGGYHFAWEGLAVGEDHFPGPGSLYLGISALNVVYATGLAFGVFNAPQLELYALPASATQQGMVSLTTQTLGQGDKTAPANFFVTLLMGASTATVTYSLIVGGSVGGSGHYKFVADCIGGTLSMGDALVSGTYFLVDVPGAVVTIGDPGGLVDLDLNGNLHITNGDLQGPSAHTLNYGFIDAATLFRCAGVDGVSGTTLEGDNVVGGIITAIGTGGGGYSLTVGTTPVSGGSPGDLLTIGAGVVSSTTIVGGAHGGLGLDLTTLASGRFLFTDGTGTVSSKPAGVTGTF